MDTIESLRARIAELEKHVIRTADGVPLRYKMLLYGVHDDEPEVIVFHLDLWNDRELEGTGPLFKRHCLKRRNVATTPDFFIELNIGEPNRKEAE